MKKALVEELKFFCNWYAIKRNCSQNNIRFGTVYFGGGTPSLANVSTLGYLLDFLRKRQMLHENCEITLEANPTDAFHEKLLAFRSIGINRISLGIQALNSNDLQYLGRTHSVEQAIQAVRNANALFPSVNIDLIYGRYRKQSVLEWQEELNMAVSLNSSHLSLYMLTLEPKTRFYDWFHSKKEFNGETIVTLPSEEVAVDLFRKSVEIAERNGFKQYEVSNFAKEGYQSRHNLHYWKGLDYIGIGPGACGRLTDCNGQRFALKQILNPEKWMNAVFSNGHGSLDFSPLSSMEKFQEVLLCGLRQVSGISYENFRQAMGNFDFDELMVGGRFYDTVQHLEKNGFLDLSEDGTFLRASPKGLLVLDSLLVDLFASMKQ